MAQRLRRPPNAHGAERENRNSSPEINIRVPRFAGIEYKQLQWPPRRLSIHATTEECGVPTAERPKTWAVSARGFRPLESWSARTVSVRNARTVLQQHR